VRLTGGLRLLPELGAVAVDLIATDEAGLHPADSGISAGTGRELPLGGELQAWRQRHGDAPDRAGYLIGRDPLSRAGQRVPGVLADIGQANGTDPVLRPARAARMPAFHPGGGSPVLFLPGLIQRSGRQRPPAPPPGRGLVQASDREPAHRAHRRRVVPGGPVQQPLRPVR